MSSIAPGAIPSRSATPDPTSACPSATASVPRSDTVTSSTVVTPDRVRTVVQPAGAAKTGAGPSATKASASGS